MNSDIFGTKAQENSKHLVAHLKKNPKCTHSDDVLFSSIWIYQLGVCIPDYSIQYKLLAASCFSMCEKLLSAFSNMQSGTQFHQHTIQYSVTNTIQKSSKGKFIKDIHSPICN